MRNTRCSIAAVLLTGFLIVPSAPAAAGTVGKEIWIGSGSSWPDYHDGAIACVRGGIGAVFVRHVGLGISAQADRDRVHYFADASVFLPRLGLLEPYGRFQVGRRDDRDDTAMGWVGGLRLGEDAVRFFLEGHGIFEPENNYGLSLGLSFF